MITREIIAEEIKKVPEKFLDELYDFVVFLKQKRQRENDSIVTHVASEEALREWNSTEEDNAWKHL